MAGLHRQPAVAAGEAMVGGLGLLLVTGLGLGLGLGVAASSGEARYIGEVLVAMLAYTPALWLTAGLAVTVLGLAPRVIGLAWAVLAWAILMVYFGGILDLPQWMIGLSPYTHIRRMPAKSFTALPLIVLITGQA